VKVRVVARNGKYEGLDPMRFFALRRSLNGCPDGRSGPSAEFFICQSFQQRSFLSSFSSLFLFPNQFISNLSQWVFFLWLFSDLRSLPAACPSLPAVKFPLL
jgi:hypothetical protein